MGVGVLVLGRGVKGGGSDGWMGGWVGGVIG